MIEKLYLWYVHGLIAGQSLTIFQNTFSVHTAHETVYKFHCQALYRTRISSHYESPQLKTVFLDLKRFEDLYLERMGNLWPLACLFGL